MRAIVEDPDDIGPRLVYADWLMERGDPRGEFIVAQCRADDESLEPGERTEWTVRAEELLAKHGRDWREPFRRAGIHRVEFRRGFVEDFTLNAEKSIDVIGDVLAECPVRKLKVRRLKKDVEKLANCPNLRALRVLNLTGGDVSGRRAKTLFESPYLADLEELHASSNGFGRMGAMAVARVKWTRLHTLDLGNNRIDPTATGILADGLPETLRDLDLCGNPHTNESIARLCGSLRLSSLRSLNVSASWSVSAGWTEAGDPEAVNVSTALALVDATFAKSLEVLRVWGWRIGPQGQQLLAERFRGLRILESRDGIDEI